MPIPIIEFVIRQPRLEDNQQYGWETQNRVRPRKRSATRLTSKLAHIISAQPI